MTEVTKRHKSPKVLSLVVSLKSFLCEQNFKDFSGCVIVSPDLKVEHLVVGVCVDEDCSTRDGCYFCYKFDVVPLTAALSGKRGVKKKSFYLSDLSSKSSSNTPVNASDITIINKMRVKHLPEVVKVVEKEGWSVY